MIHATGLLDEPPISFYPRAAKALDSVNKALILQQIHFLITSARTAENAYVFVNERWWVYNSYEEWHRRYFTWLSPSSIKRILQDLEGTGLVLTMQSVKSALDRRKWYTIDYRAWEKFISPMGPKESDATDQNDPSMGSKESHDLSETPSETPSERSTSASGDAAAPGPSKNNPEEQEKPIPPHVALIDAYHGALPDDVRPPDPNYSRNSPAARKLRDAAVTPDQVALFVAETYPTYRKWSRKHGAPELMSLDHVVTYIKSFLTRKEHDAANQPDPGRTPDAIREQQRQIAERYQLDGDD